MWPTYGVQQEQDMTSAIYGFVSGYWNWVIGYWIGGW
jgi:hypothetical protein